jgi:hypothetical protein
MGLPCFPRIPPPPPKKVLLGLLLQTIVFEEQALAAMINAEAEKVQKLVETGIAGPMSADEVSEINRSVAEVIRFAGEKQDRLLRKLQTILAAVPAHLDKAEEEHDD